ncbi:MAG: hypothetical protein EF812_05595 [Methanosarcinales archaeon]|nr:MAG: hypothetical protein EF812_05595 [Methanosarcinales archaeon]
MRKKDGFETINKESIRLILKKAKLNIFQKKSNSWISHGFVKILALEEYLDVENIQLVMDNLRYPQRI